MIVWEKWEYQNYVMVVDSQKICVNNTIRLTTKIQNISQHISFQRYYRNYNQKSSQNLVNFAKTMDKIITTTNKA